MILRVVSCYVPQIGCNDEKKAEFWRSIDVHIRSTGPEERLQMGGDLNGHVSDLRNGHNQFLAVTVTVYKMKKAPRFSTAPKPMTSRLYILSSRNVHLTLQHTLAGVVRPRSTISSYAGKT